MRRARRLTSAVRWLAFLLCLLAASPLTAPFSTLDVADLCDSDQPRPAAALQLKNAKGDPVCSPGGLPALPAFAAAVAEPDENSTPPLTPHRRIHSILRL